MLKNNLKSNLRKHKNRNLLIQVYIYCIHWVASLNSWSRLNKVI